MTDDNAFLRGPPGGTASSERRSEPPHSGCLSFKARPKAFQGPSPKSGTGQRLKKLTLLKSGLQMKIGRLHPQCPSMPIHAIVIFSHLIHGAGQGPTQLLGVGGGDGSPSTPAAGVNTNQDGVGFASLRTYASAATAPHVKGRVIASTPEDQLCPLPPRRPKAA